MPITIRIGDLAATMICATYKKEIERREIAFEVVDELHKSLRADVLFADVIDQFFHNETQLDPKNPAFEIYDPGVLWVVAPFYVREFGGAVIPKIKIDDAIYAGPDLDWGNYTVFCPLIDAQYNTPRNMSIRFVNSLIEKIHKNLGDRLIVITKYPEIIDNEAVNVFATDRLYDIIYVLSKCKRYIGGDTGFTHFAGLLRVPEMIAIYGANSYEDNYINRVGFDRPFSLQGQFLFQPFVVFPNVDPEFTKIQIKIMSDNSLAIDEIETTVN